MPLEQVIVLALIQGITELLPISSSAHLAVVPWIFHWPDQGLTFDVALHVGTLLAIGLYFLKAWVDILLHRHRLLAYLAWPPFRRPWSARCWSTTLRPLCATRW